MSSAAKFIQYQRNFTFHITFNYPSQLPHQIGLRFLPLGIMRCLLSEWPEDPCLLWQPAQQRRGKIWKEAKLYSGLFCFWVIFSHFFQHCYSVAVKAKLCNSYSTFKKLNCISAIEFLFSSLLQAKGMCYSMLSHWRLMHKNCMEILSALELEWLYMFSNQTVYLTALQEPAHESSI